MTIFICLLDLSHQHEPCHVTSLLRKQLSLEFHASPTPLPIAPFSLPPDSSASPLRSHVDLGSPISLILFSPGATQSGVHTPLFTQMGLAKVLNDPYITEALWWQRTVWLGQSQSGDRSRK